jgi:small subunit ribosomal protein S13
MARIAGVDLPRNKRMDIALTYIYGIGRTSAAKILAAAEIDATRRSDDLNDAEINAIRQVTRSRATSAARSRGTSRDTWTWVATAGCAIGADCRCGASGRTRTRARVRDRAKR